MQLGGWGGGAECSRCLRNRTCSRSRASSAILPTVHYFEFFRTRSPFVGRFLSKYSPPLPLASMVPPPPPPPSQPVKEDANGRCTHARPSHAHTRTHASAHEGTNRQQCCINKPWRPVTWSP